MSKELVISASSHERRVAILEEGQLVEIYIEREKEFALVGSIYKGKVTRVLPGIKGKDAGHTDRETAWCSKPEEKDVLGISRLARCQELAGRTADDAVLTLKIL